MRSQPRHQPTKCIHTLFGILTGAKESALILSLILLDSCAIIVLFAAFPHLPRPIWGMRQQSIQVEERNNFAESFGFSARFHEELAVVKRETNHLLHVRHDVHVTQSAHKKWILQKINISLEERIYCIKKKFKRKCKMQKNAKRMQMLTWFKDKYVTVSCCSCHTFYARH